MFPPLKGVKFDEVKGFFPLGSAVQAETSLKTISHHMQVGSVGSAQDHLFPLLLSL